MVCWPVWVGIPLCCYRYGVATYTTFPVSRHCTVNYYVETLKLPHNLHPPAIAWPERRVRFCRLRLLPLLHLVWMNRFSPPRSAERRVGNECVRTCSSRCVRYNSQKDIVASN